MIYIISGYMRSGTSMMMDALSAGGMDTLKEQARDEFAKMLSDDRYKPNPAGLHEITPKSIREMTKAEAEGKAFKVVSPWLHHLPIIDHYKVCFMLRDVQEIKESFLAMLQPNAWKPFVQGGIEQSISDSIKTLENRRDADVLLLSYDDVIAWPLAAMSFLKANGWPIDPEKAAKVPKKDKKRFESAVLEPTFQEAGR